MYYFAATATVDYLFFFYRTLQFSSSRSLSLAWLSIYSTANVKRLATARRGFFAARGFRLVAKRLEISREK
jgi:hypothetical protein